MRFSETLADYGPRMASGIDFTFHNGTSFKVSATLIAHDIAMSMMMANNGKKAISLKALKTHIKNKMHIYEAFHKFKYDHPDIIKHYETVTAPDYHEFDTVLESYILEHTRELLGLSLHDLHTELNKGDKTGHAYLVFKEVNTSFTEFLMNVHKNATDLKMKFMLESSKD